MTRRIRFSVPWSMRCAAAVAAGLVAANGASAFFFKGWPGDGRPRERSLLPPGPKTTEPPEPEWPPPPDEPPRKEKPPGVPEPATGLLAGVGIGVVALARRRKCRAG